MAELTKKLHFKKNTTEHLAKAYSTTAEAGAEYITNKIDGVTAYVPIGATNDSRATVGRVKKSGGTEKVILTMGKPPYTEKSWTTPGTYTFTVPQGITRIRVAVCGGGGAGAFGATEYKWEDGGTSNFGNLIQATGGVSGMLGSIDNYSDLGYLGKGGAPNGRQATGSGASPIYGGAGFSLSFSLTNGNYGKGGNNGYMGIGDAYRSAGGSGGYNSGYVNVVTGNTYTIVVGKEATKLLAGYAGYETASILKGNAGFVLIAYGGDI